MYTASKISRYKASDFRAAKLKVLMLLIFYIRTLYGDLLEIIREKTGMIPHTSKTSKLIGCSKISNKRCRMNGKINRSSDKIV